MGEKKFPRNPSTGPRTTTGEVTLIAALEVVDDSFSEEPDPANWINANGRDELLVEYDAELGDLDSIEVAAVFSNDDGETWRWVEVVPTPDSEGVSVLKKHTVQIDEAKASAFVFRCRAMALVAFVPKRSGGSGEGNGSLLTLKVAGGLTVTANPQ